VIRPAALLLALLQGPPAAPAPDYPFVVGETLTYSAKLGMLTLGSGTLQVASLDSVRGHETFRFRFRLTGKTARPAPSRPPSTPSTMPRSSISSEWPT